MKKESPETVSLSRALSRSTDFKDVAFWIIGDTPLITHAWSEKARRELLSKQVKATKGGKEARDPHQDFVNSLYDMGDGSFGFPATGVKNCILSAAHKDKGIARSTVMSALWLNADMVRTRPAHAGAVCDMPLVRIYGSQPAMREDTVRIGAITKTATMAYRGQFTIWALRITGRLNSSALTPDALAFLVSEAGLSAGLGEWRNEKKGMFGSFHLASQEEELAWEAFRSGEGPMPLPESYSLPQAAE